MEGVQTKIARGQWVFSGILISLGFVSWLLIYLGFYRVYTDFQIQIWIAAFVSIFIFSIGITLSYFLLHPFKVAAISYLLLSALSFLFFQSISAVGIFFFTTLLGYISVKKEQKLIVNFLYSRIIRRGLPIFFTGLALCVAIFYNTSPIGQINEIPQFSEEFVGVILVPIEYALKPSIPDFRKDMLIKDIGDISARELPRFIDLPPAVITGIVKDFFAQFPKDVRNKTIVEFLHDIVNTQLRTILLPYKQFLPFIYLFGLFFVFKGIGMPLMWLSIGVGWLLTKILLKFNVLKLKKISIEKEELVL
jgi:hypothetical protein